MAAAISVPTVHSAVEKARGANEPVQGVGLLLRLFEVAPVGAGSSDYADGVVHEAARAARCDAIVTQYGSDFAAATLPVYAPAELPAALAARSPRAGPVPRDGIRPQAR